MPTVRLATPPAIKKVQETAGAALAGTSKEVMRALERPERHMPILASLMAPVTVVAYVMAFWRFAADMNWTGEFFVSSGLLSKWQVWLAVAAAMHAASHNVNRPSKPKNSALS